MNKMSGEKKTVYDRLRKLRKSKKSSIAKIAKETGIYTGTLGNYFSGKRTPNAEQIVKLCKAFDVSADWLLGISDVNMRDKRSVTIDDEAIKEMYELLAGIMEQQMEEYIAAPLMKKIMEGILGEMKDNKHIFERYFARRDGAK